MRDKHAKSVPSHHMRLDFAQSADGSYNPVLYNGYTDVGYNSVSLGALDPQQQQIAGMAATAATTTAAILAKLGTLGAMGGPIGLAVAGIVAVGMALANAFAGCGQTCVAATNIANQVEPLLGKNKDDYINSPIRYRSMQLAALNNFDFTWAALVKACSNPQLQAAGQRCISDRQRGSCIWKDHNNACWNWFLGYRDPIANDPGVQPDPPNTTATVDPQTGQVTYTPTVVGSLSNALGSIPTPLLVGGAGLVGLLILSTAMGGGRR